MNKQGQVVDPDAQEICAKNSSTEGVGSDKGENTEAK
jgi:hypothetical protein